MNKQQSERTVGSPFWEPQSIRRKIQPYKPSDKQTAIIISKGERYEEPYYKRRKKGNHWNTKPETIPINRWGKVGLKNLIGMIRGKITVIGLLEYHKEMKSEWLIRCECGNYEMRKHRTLLKQSVIYDSCEKCKHLHHLGWRKINE